MSCISWCYHSGHQLATSSSTHPLLHCMNPQTWKSLRLIIQHMWSFWIFLTHLCQQDFSLSFGCRSVLCPQWYMWYQGYAAWTYSHLTIMVQRCTSFWHYIHWNGPRHAGHARHWCHPKSTFSSLSSIMVLNTIVLSWTDSLTSVTKLMRIQGCG